MQEMQVWSLGQEDPLEEGMATHSSILPGESHDRGAWRTTVHRVAKSQTRLCNWACAYLKNPVPPSTGSKTSVCVCMSHACVCVCVGRVCTGFVWSRQDSGHLIESVSASHHAAPSSIATAALPWLHCCRHRGHRAHLFLCCWLHPTTTSVISSCRLAGWPHRGQAPATSSCCYWVVYAHSKQWSLQKPHHAPALLGELAQSPPALPAHAQGTWSYSSLKNIGKWTEVNYDVCPI